MIYARNCRTRDADILKQVRDGEFEQALHERLELAEREKRDAIALAKAEVTNALQKAAAAKDTEIQALKAQLDAGKVERRPVVAVQYANYDTQFLIRGYGAEALLAGDKRTTCPPRATIKSVPVC